MTTQLDKQYIVGYEGIVKGIQNKCLMLSVFQF
jgi:hypothetical protein